MYSALFYASGTVAGDDLPIRCQVTPDGLYWEAPQIQKQWSFSALSFQERPEHRGYLIRHLNNDQGLIYSDDYALLNALLPHLTGPERQQALTLYQNHRPARGQRVLLFVLLGMACMAGILWLFFWGQIQLRKQQLALADPQLPKVLEARQWQIFQQQNALCSSPRVERLAQQLLDDYRAQSQTDHLRRISFFASPLAESLMLSDGHLLLSTRLLKDMSGPTLAALMAHQEGHLMLKHRLESRIYEQGNQIFKRLWHKADDTAFLLDAPLWVQYSRGQEAAADQWAFRHLDATHQSDFDFKGLAKQALLYLDDPLQQKGLVARHPWATDRLQGIVQRPEEKKSLEKRQQINLEYVRKTLHDCEQKRMDDLSR